MSARTRVRPRGRECRRTMSARTLTCVRADAGILPPGNFKKDATVRLSHGRPRGHRPIVRPSVRPSVWKRPRDNHARCCVGCTKGALRSSIGWICADEAKEGTGIVEEDEGCGIQIGFPVWDSYGYWDTLGVACWDSYGYPDTSSVACWDSYRYLDTSSVACWDTYG
jgi:hypothetical protein